MKYAVETFSLTKIFSDWWGRNRIYAVEDMNLKVRENEVYGLLGPNGSGKTTTLKLLMGLLHPTKGRVSILGGDVTDTSIRSHIGFMPEESYLYRYLTARETLNFYGRLFNLPTDVRKSRTEALLEMVGLKAAANRVVGTFSKGMARRIGLAQALINDPQLLILDEPTTGLDPVGTYQIKELLGQLARRGKTILMCSHLLADVEDICDRISILYGGRIQVEGRVEDLLEQTGKRQITTGPISDPALEQIKQIIERQRADYTVNCPMDSLETFFVKTISAAQQKQKRTSGAISTTQISDFLAAQKVEDSIIDKLVSSDMSASTAPLTTEPADSVEPAPDKLDEQMLSDLTDKSEPAAPKTVKPSRPVKPQQDAIEQIEQDVLEELTGQSEDSTDNHAHHREHGEQLKGDVGDE